MPFKLGGGHAKKGEVSKKVDAPKSELKTETTSSESQKGPITKAFAIEQKVTKWILHRYQLQDGKVISDIPSDPEPKALCVERFKIEFAKAFLFGTAPKTKKPKTGIKRVILDPKPKSKWENR